MPDLGHNPWGRGGGMSVLILIIIFSYNKRVFRSADAGPGLFFDKITQLVRGQFQIKC